MKELSIEEKAQRYDEAIKIAKEWYNKTEPDSYTCIVESIFPELKESEDEKIKQRVIKLIKMSNEVGGFALHKWEADEMLAWVEKQGGQKLADKVESKFKIGDWIIYEDNIWKICHINLNTYYELLKINNELSIRHIEGVDNTARLWTIQDAKDGDVLAGHESYVIFKEIDGLNIKCHCTYHYMGFKPSFYINTLQNKDAFRPATKEQRDALMKVMTDAGWEFDFEKKELKKVEQSHTWSEEDERYLSYAIHAVEDMLGNNGKNTISWLKSLKDRVQPNQEWSEEDKKRMDNLYYFLEEYGGQYYGESTLKDMINWLKSLRPQNNITDEELAQAKKEE